MPFNHSPPLQLYELTYAPGYTPNGVPRDQRASRQVLQHRQTTRQQGITAQGATDAFERDAGVMVTACKRVQLDGVTA